MVLDAGWSLVSVDDNNNDDEGCTACLTSTSYKHTSTVGYKHGMLGMDVQPTIVIQRSEEGK
jgi:hypothetical protein